MSNKEYDPKLVQYAFDVNARLGIPEEQTALAIAQDFGKEKELQQALDNRKKTGWIYRTNAEDITSILTRVCIPAPEPYSTTIIGDNILMPRAATYAQGVAELKKLGEQPKTFRENIEARVVAYENGDRSLFNTWLDSCTAVVYKARSTEFKILPKSEHLVAIPENFNDVYLSVLYDDVKDTFDLDSRNGEYNQLLVKGQPLVHEGWLAAVLGDKMLLKAYHDIIFKGFKKDRAMGFYVEEDTAQDELRALFVGDLDGNSVANGSGNLFSVGSFLRVAPVAAQKK